MNIGDKGYVAEPLNAFQDETPFSDIIIDKYNEDDEIWYDCENTAFCESEIGIKVFSTFEEAQERLYEKYKEEYMNYMRSK